MSSNIAAILKVILYIGIFSQLLPLVFFLLYKFRSREKGLRVIFYYILYCVLNEGLSVYLQTTHSSKIYILFSFYTVAEFSFFCLFYYYIISSKKVKKIIIPIWASFALFSITDFFFVNRMDDFDSIAVAIASIIIILLCAYYLFMQIKGSISLQIYSTSNFWIIITFLIYLSGTFFLYLMTEAMKTNDSFQKQYIYINSSFNILKNVLLSIAMLMKPAEAKPEKKRNYEWDDFHPLN